MADIDIATMAILDMLNGVRERYRRGGPLSLEQIIDHYTTIVRRIPGVR